MFWALYGFFKKINSFLTIFQGGVISVGGLVLVKRSDAILVLKNLYVCICMP